MKRRPSSKRQGRFPRIISRLGILVGLLLVAYFLGGRLQPGQTRYILLSPDHYPPGTIHPITITLKKGGALFVVNDAGTYLVLVATDPHDNCRVHWIQNEQAFASYCSDARYDVSGRWLAGPSRRGLNRYHAFIHKGNLVIDTERLIKGPPRPDDSPSQSTTQ